MYDRISVIQDMILICCGVSDLLTLHTPDLYQLIAANLRGSHTDFIKVFCFTQADFMVRKFYA